MIISKNYYFKFFLLTFIVLINTFSYATSRQNISNYSNFILYDSEYSSQNSSLTDDFKSDYAYRFLKNNKNLFQNGDYLLKAAVSFKEVNRTILGPDLSFKLAPKISDQYSNNWKLKDSIYFGIVGQNIKYNYLQLPIINENFELSKLNEYNEIWFDYESVPGLQVCSPSLILTGNKKRYDLNKNLNKEFSLSYITNYDLIKIQSQIKFKEIILKEKKFVYILKRLFGLNSQKEWVYSKKNNAFVIQNSLNAPLNNIEYIDIFFNREVSVNRINLVIGNHSFLSKNRVFEYENINRINLQDGKVSIRIDLRNQLGSLNKGDANQQIYLKELLIFTDDFKNNLPPSISNLKIDFLGFDKFSTDANYSRNSNESVFISRTIKFDDGRQRMVVNLKEIDAHPNINFNKMDLIFKSSNEGLSTCAIKPIQIKAVSLFEGKLKSYNNNIYEFSKRWISNPIFDLPYYKKIEAPKIIRYLPLTVFGRELSNKSFNTKINNFNEVNLSVKNSKFSYNDFSKYLIKNIDETIVSRDQNILISSDGSTLSSFDSLPTLSIIENDLLLLEGKNLGTLKISIPISASLNRNSSFYFGVHEGVEQISDIILELTMSNGLILRQRIIPNKAFPLLINEATVNDIKLYIVPSVSSYKYKFKEIALVSSILLDYNETFNHKLPTKFNVFPEPILKSQHSPENFALDRGSLSGILESSTALLFSTPIDPVLNWVDGIHLDFNFSLNTIIDEPCFLKLQFNWTNGKTNRLVCFNKNSTSFFIPISDLLGPRHNDFDLGVLKSIDWLLYSNIGKNEKLNSFSLKFSISGWSLISAAEQFHHLPLFKSGYYSVFSDVEKIKYYDSTNYQKKIWLPLENKSANYILLSHGIINPIENWLFTLDQIVAMPSSFFEIKDSNIISGISNKKYIDNDLIILLLFLILIIIIFLFFYKKYQINLAMNIAYIHRILKYILHILCLGMVKAKKNLWHNLHKINLIVAILSLGPGFWFAGQYGLSFKGIMILAMACLVSWGAYYHWRSYTELSSHCKRLPLTIKFCIFFSALGCSAWSLGLHKFSEEALWGFLPLIGAIYLLLPFLYTMWRRYVKTYRNYLLLFCWMILSLIFYVTSLFINITNEKNLYLNLGNLCFFLLLRSILLILKNFLCRTIPIIAKYIYDGDGNLFFAGALATLVIAGLLWTINLEPISEQFAVITFYFLLVGASQMFWSQHKKYKNGLNHK